MKQTPTLWAACTVAVMALALVAAAMWRGFTDQSPFWLATAIASTLVFIELTRVIEHFRTRGNR